MSTETEALARLAGRSPAGSAAGYRPPVAPAYVYLLAEHLDSALAAGEDLIGEHFTWHTASPRNEAEVRRERTSRRIAIASIRGLETSLVARILRARDHAEMLARKDDVFRPVARLFLSGTLPLADAAADIAGSEEQHFATGDAVTAYLRSRALIEPDAAAPLDGATVAVTERFLIAARIDLGVLMDMIAMFLDVLETQYDLFGDGDSASATPAETATASPVPEPAPSLSLEAAIAAARAAVPAAVTEVESEVDANEGAIPEAELQPSETNAAADASPDTENPVETLASLEAEPAAASASEAEAPEDTAAVASDAPVVFADAADNPAESGVPAAAAPAIDPDYAPTADETPDVLGLATREPDSGETEDDDSATEAPGVSEPAAHNETEATASEAMADDELVAAAEAITAEAGEETDASARRPEASAVVEPQNALDVAIRAILIEHHA